MTGSLEYPDRIVAGTPDDQTVLELQPGQFVVKFRDGVTDSEIDDWLTRFNLHPTGQRTSLPQPQPSATPGWRWVQLSEGRASGELASQILERSQGQIIMASPVYYAEHQGIDSAVSPMPSTLLVQFTKGTEEQGAAVLAERFNFTHDDAISPLLEPFHKFRLTPDRQVENLSNRDAFGEPSGIFKALPEIEMLSFVESVEIDWLVYNPLQAIPDDSFWENQWGMTRIDMPEAWDVQAGDPDVWIAVVDSGCDLTHPDLLFTPNAGGALTHFNAAQAESGALPPYNAAPDPSDANGAHGSLVAGIAAGRRNNMTGIAGVAGNCAVMPIRVFPMATMSRVAAGINWARTNGARVINVSLGAPVASPVVDTAIVNAWAAGIVICAATGNYYSASEPASAPVEFPGRQANTIGVGASDQNDQRKRPASADAEQWGSNYGPGIDVVAPGVQLWSTDRQGAAGWNFNSGGPLIWNGVSYANSGDAAGDYFALMGGSSGAAPVVAGIAALLFSHFPAITNQMVRDTIESTCEKVNSVLYPYSPDMAHPNGTWHEQIGYGRVNAKLALLQAGRTITGRELVSGTITRHRSSTAGDVDSADAADPATNASN